MASSPAPPPTTLTFLGAAGTVTGSKYLLTVGQRQVLVDSGLFQGEKQWRLMNWEPFATDPASISDVILTHAHLDHVGYLPALVRNGFSGPIWCTPGTRQLAEIVLRDAAHLQEREAADANQQGYSKHHPALALYDTADVERMLPQFVDVPYDTDVELTGAAHHEPITIRMTRAGHILGSASVNVWTPTAAALFSGDLGRLDHPVLKSRDTPVGAPYVLIESTYGDREHPDPVNLPHEGFADVIRRTIARGGTVVIPAFAIDRTEVVLKTISELERDGRIPDVPVYVNSPMGVRALRVYQSMPEELRDDIRPEDFVQIPDLTAVESAEESMALTAPGGHGPAVIISSSGMATGGRVLHHLEGLLPDPKNAVILTGYQGVGTRGRQLSDGDQQIKIRGKYVPVRAEIFHDREFSVHADRSDLIAWLRDLDPQPTQVFCVHGEQDSSEAFAAVVRAELGVSAVVPRHGEVVALDSGDVRRPAATVPAHRPAPAAQPQSTPAGIEYRLITGVAGDEFDRAVSAALADGFELHDAPVARADGERVTVAQAVVRRRAGQTATG